MQILKMTSSPSSAADQTRRFVLNLSAAGATMLPLVGGKAANLGELIRAQFPVPDGVCVTTEGYHAVAASARIDFDALASARPEDVAALASDARRALLTAPVPSAVAQEIEEAYHSLGAQVPVAVRSSATAEDLPNASFAGQQDTYLHVIGAGAVLDAVRRCWASLWTERAVVYRSKNGIDHRAVRLAVVIQRMVDASVAGVLFTANPVTGKRRQAVIDASPGLGEAVVSGAVNPDHFVVDTSTRQIVERRLGDKRVQVRALPGGGTGQIEVDATSQESCVSDGQIRALTALGDRVEAHYGAPQDTEWAIDGEGKLWLTQARPITTLYPIPDGARPEELGVYFCFSVAQGLYGAITPMGMAGLRLLASAVAGELGISVEKPLEGPPVWAEAGQRLFVNLTSILRGKVGRALMTRVLDIMESRSAVVLRELGKDPRFSLTKRTPFLLIRRVLRLAVHHGLPAQVIRALAKPEALHEQVRRTGEELASSLQLSDSATASERLDFVERALLTGVLPRALRVMPAAAAGLMLHAVAQRLVGSDADASEFQTVLRGMPHNVTTEMDLKLWGLACEIRQDPAASQMLREMPAAELAMMYHRRALPAVAQEGLAEFLARYGHRAVAEIDLGLPRWSDDPAHLLGVLANYLRLERTEAAPDAVFARGASEAEAAIDALVKKAGRRSRLRATLVRFALRRTRQLSGLREVPKYYVIVVFGAVRRELQRIGRELLRQGRIDNAADVFFLNLAEVREALSGRDFRPTVESRKEVHESESRRRHLPRVLLSDGTEPEMRLISATQTGGMTGTPASAGTVTGVARVVLNPVGAHIEPGEILVAPSTDPGWTPLFLTAGGLVMEMGGANSHGAVVAREYGIPAVVGVMDATGRIKTGQRITVDGSNGSIVIES
ncbi:MAG: PEP/pyruvate-binding domain-containing protein [Paludibaculum sp.]